MELLRGEGLQLLNTKKSPSEVLVSDISLSVSKGETVAVVGESGSGKSLTAKALMGLLPQGIARRGKIVIKGQDTAQWTPGDWRRVRGSTIGMVMQDPFTSLHPSLRCGDHIMECLPEGTHREKRRRVAELLDEVGIHDPSVAQRYPFELSGGMCQRVCIAAVLSRQPEIIIADEPTTALDASTQTEIVDLLKSIQQARRVGIVFITHDLRLAFSMCDRVVVLYSGTTLEVGDARAVQARPMHPYTRGLLLADPPVDVKLGRLPEIGGSVAKASEVQDACAFAPRCQWVAPECTAGRPPLREVAPNRFSRCIRIEEIVDELTGTESLEPVAEVAAEPAGVSVLAVQGLVKRFGSRRHPVVAVDGVDLEVRSGECVAVVGESGSGKSTIGRCIVGLESPSGGSIVVEGEPVQFGSRGVKRASGRRLHAAVQMVFQDPYSSLNPVRTIGATLAEAIAMSGDAASAGEVGRLLTLVGLPADYAKRLPVALSGGERQRVAVARALAVKPRLVVCDEPTSSLDVSIQAQVLNLLSSIRQELGLAYLFITHNLAVVRQIADRVVVMRNGTVVESGSTTAVLDHPSAEYTRALLHAVPDWERADPEG